MKKIIFIYIALIIVVIILALTRITNFGGFFGNVGSSGGSVTIKESTYKVSVAREEKDLIAGLSETKKLNEDKGMLFIFDKKGKYTFWMKNMKFPIDILFIDTPQNDKGEFESQGKIVDIVKNAPIPIEGAPLSDLPRYTPKTDSNMVLEINAGQTDKNGFAVGDIITLEGIK